MLVVFAVICDLLSIVMVVCCIFAGFNISGSLKIVSGTDAFDCTSR
jgi:hypothetical protein